ncbi:unnamed protein product [Linum tenue]|uniref:Aspartate racemase n=1 Tax=Linum tenue TaxID=586396 RepID=A0AAV0S842_9ROSI|nr:unnamed protein product [Linum tenue]
MLDLAMYQNLGSSQFLICRMFLQPDMESRSSLLSRRIAGAGSSATRNQALRLPMSHRKNTVGIIAGVSVYSALTFLEKLAWMSSRESEDCPPFLLSYDPTLIGLRPNCSSPVIVDNLRGKRMFLEQSGVHCLVMPCHVSHHWYGEISEGCPLPFFHFGNCVAGELRDANLKPIVGGTAVRIGVLATYAVLEAGFYQEMLQKQGFEAVVPDKATVNHILIPGIEALSKGDMEGAQILLRIAIQILLVRGVNIVILASDEIQGILPDKDPLLKKCMIPVDALARAVLSWARLKGQMRADDHSSY